MQRYLWRAWWMSYAVAISTIFDVLILPVSTSNYELILSRTYLPLWFAAGLSWTLVHENKKGGF